MARPPSPPIVVTGPSVTIGDLNFGGATGGWPGGQAPLGGTFVVGPNGDVIVGDGYGGCAACGVFLITPAGVQSVIANFGNSNAAGMDQYGNAYIARDYGSSIIKLPYSAATGTYTGFTTLPTANCLGGTQDTAACVFASGSQSLFAGENGGFSSLFFDGQGNFFFSTDTNPANNPDTIYECAAEQSAELAVLLRWFSPISRAAWARSPSIPGATCSSLTALTTARIPEKLATSKNCHYQVEFTPPRRP